MDPITVHADGNSTPGELIAAIPALVRQTPAEAVVFLLARKGFIRSHEVFPLGGSPNLLFARMTRMIDRTAADTAYLIGITAAIVAPIPGQFARMPDRFRSLPGALTATLADHGVTAAGMWGTPALEAAAPWWSLAGLPRTGVIADPATVTPTVADQVLTAIHNPRSEAVELLTANPVLTASITAALPAARTDAEERLAAAIRRNDPEPYFRQELDTVRDFLLTLTGHAAHDTEPDPAELARMVVTLRCERVRSALYEVVTDPSGWLRPGTDPDADLALFGQLVVGTEGPDQADAATLLALALYTRAANPVAAEVAIEIAIRANPHHQVAPAIREAIYANAHPADVRAAFQHTPH